MGPHEAIDHVIWDWNGTLLDDTDACVEVSNRMLARRRLPGVDKARYRELFGFPARNYYLAVGFRLDEEDWDAVAREFHGHYAETSRTAPLHAGAESILAGLQARGLPMSVLSACEQAILERMMDERGVTSRFGRIRGVNDLHGHSKLDVGRDLMRDLALDGSRVLLVGDTAHDHEVATCLGCRCVLVEGGHQSGRRLRACGCEVVEGLAALARGFDL